MSRHHPSNGGSFDDAVRVAALLRPRVESAVRRLPTQARTSLRNSVISCERALADATSTPQDRLRRVHDELQADVAFGATWRLIQAAVDEYRADVKGAAVGRHELGSVSLILGQILAAIAAAENREAA